MKPNHTTVAILMGFLVFLLLGAGLINGREPVHLSPNFDPLEEITPTTEIFENDFSRFTILLYSFAGLTVIAILIVSIMILEEGRRMLVLI